MKTRTFFLLMLALYFSLPSFVWGSESNVKVSVCTEGWKKIKEERTKEGELSVTFDFTRHCSQGTGTIIDPTQILTVAHVFDRKYNRIYILVGKKEYEATASLIQRQGDRALLSLKKAVDFPNLQVRKKDFSSLKGQEVIIAGFPHGGRQKTLKAVIRGFITTNKLFTLEVLTDTSDWDTWVWKTSDHGIVMDKLKGMSGSSVRLSRTGEIVGILTGYQWDKTNKEMGYMLATTPPEEL